MSGDRAWEQTVQGKQRLGRSVEALGEEPQAEAPGVQLKGGQDTSEGGLREWKKDRAEDARRKHGRVGRI